jgi:hypothetical protein
MRSVIIMSAVSFTLSCGRRTDPLDVREPAPASDLATSAEIVVDLEHHDKGREKLLCKKGKDGNNKTVYFCKTDKKVVIEVAKPCDKPVEIPPPPPPPPAPTPVQEPVGKGK